MSGPWHAILTPTQRAGAIAVIMLDHTDLQSLGLTHPGVHRVRLLDMVGIDQGVVLGLTDSQALLMPHGGVAIVRAISERLCELGCPLRNSTDPITIYPEARSEIEANCLYALSIATSPLAVDVLLAHNERWHTLGVETIERANQHAVSIGGESPLGRLLREPNVAAVGRANVGKSSLINALIGQQVALVADSAGTTRDHIGAPVDLGGLVVRWVDTPGVDERIGETDELTIAQAVLGSADLVIHCIDAVDDPGVLDPRLTDAIAKQTPVLRVGTRADLGEHTQGCDLRVSVGARASGIPELVTRIRAMLVPNEALSDPRPWRFWDSLGPGC